MASSKFQKIHYPANSKDFLVVNIEIDCGASKAFSVFLPSRSGHCQRKLKHTTCGFVVWCRIINKPLLQFIGTNILARNQPVRGHNISKLTNKTPANFNNSNLLDSQCQFRMNNLSRDIVQCKVIMLAQRFANNFSETITQAGLCTIMSHLALQYMRIKIAVEAIQTRNN